MALHLVGLLAEQLCVPRLPAVLAVPALVTHNAIRNGKALEHSLPVPHVPVGRLHEDRQAALTHGGDQADPKLAPERGHLELRPVRAIDVLDLQVPVLHFPHRQIRRLVKCVDCALDARLRVAVLVVQWVIEEIAQEAWRHVHLVVQHVAHVLFDAAVEGVLVETRVSAHMSEPEVNPYVADVCPQNVAPFGSRPRSVVRRGPGARIVNIVALQLLVHRVLAVRGQAAAGTGRGAGWETSERLIRNNELVLGVQVCRASDKVSVRLELVLELVLELELELVLELVLELELVLCVELELVLELVLKLELELELELVLELELE